MFAPGGSSVGEVLRITSWGEESDRSGARVSWQRGAVAVLAVYRVGHFGQVDLITVKGANGPLYYPEHLPLIGK